MHTKSSIIILFCLMFVFDSGFSQVTDKSYQLKWKIGKEEIIPYSIESIPLEDSKIDLSQAFSSLMKSQSIKKDSSNINGEIDELVKNLKEEQKNLTQVGTIENKGNLLYARIFIKNNQKKEANSSKYSFENIMQGIQFRGLLNKNGSIYSYFLQTTQKNLLALYFQLPDKPVKIGDAWPIDLQWLSANYTFHCDSANKINAVTFKDLYTKGSDTIAVLNYYYSETLSGSTSMPLSDEVKPSYLHMDYSGIVEFNISMGRWENYNLIITSISKGFQNSSSRQLCKLTETTLSKEDKKLLKKD
jgi:hypothetical protein